MKLFSLIALFSLVISTSAFASVGQTDTDCPMMRESHERKNTKENLSSLKQSKNTRGTRKGSAQ